jgi:hypothetical protein
VNEVPAGPEPSGTPLVIAPSIHVSYPSSEATAAKADKKTLATVQPIEDDVRLNTIQTVTAEPLKEPDGWHSDTSVMASTGTETSVTDNAVNENDQVEKKGIRNAGDLINFVVEKIDKREQKFLKFSTDEDDNSSLVGINIGFIKINSRKHK